MQELNGILGANGCMAVDQFTHSNTAHYSLGKQCTDTDTLPQITCSMYTCMEALLPVPLSFDNTHWQESKLPSLVTAPPTEKLTRQSTDGKLLGPLLHQYNSTGFQLLVTQVKVLYQQYRQNNFKYLELYWLVKAFQY